MRSQEERMAEIRRRSNMLIEERKKKRKIIWATCVPLILCVVIGGLWLFPKGTATESIPYEAVEAMTEMGETEEETQPQTRPAIFTETSIAYSSYTDYPGVTVEILSLEESDGKTSLRVLWKNETDKEMIYGSSFFIDSWQGDHWQSCQVNEDLIFTAIAYFLEPGQEREETYTLTGVYSLPEEGSCRFRTECFVYETPEESLHCELWDTFELNKGG